ncbi:MAG: ATP-binding cassette domain-containing protein [Anaerolineaceae bacterium]|nr:ATP-binding cassette domain-containing protein [Anaerolineaceae bacterium]
MITISHLSFKYPQSNAPILRDISLQIPARSLTLVAGASGSGKSTLLHSLNGLVPHFTGGEISGSIDVFGQNSTQFGPEKMAQSVSFVFQEPEAQFIYERVEDEIAFALERSGLDQTEMQSRVNKACDILGIGDLQLRKIATLSGGEKQRVAIASALVTEPRLLILDEPTSQLDPQGADDILHYILDLQSRLDLTILLSEHRLERVLPYVNHMVYLPGDGAAYEGTPQDVLPMMDLVPPIIQIGKALNITPLPIRPEDLQKVFVTQTVKQAKVEEVTGSKPALNLTGLTVNINNHQILNDISLSINQGEILAMMGPNGAGKTTLLRSVLGLVPSQGIREVMGQNIKGQSLNSIIRQVAYLPQNPNDLLFSESVLEELKVTLTNHGLDISQEEMLRHLHNLGLDKLASAYPRDLSVGERQRVALAAITIYNPPVILLDEPTRGLDYGNKQQLVQLLQSWKHQKKAILVVTHDVEFAALQADAVIVLNNGQTTYFGPPQPLFTQNSRYRTQTAQAFPKTGWYRVSDILFEHISTP